MDRFVSFEHEIIFEKFLLFKENPAPDNSFSKDIIDLLNYVQEMKKYSLINYYKKIGSHKKVIGRLLISVKKSVRKSLSWLLGPIIEQQSNFNVTAINSGLRQVETFQRVIQGLAETYVKKTELEAEISSIKNKLNDCIMENGHYKHRLEDMEKILNRIADADK